MKFRLHVEANTEEELQKLADLIHEKDPTIDVYIYDIEEE